MEKIKFNKEWVESVTKDEFIEHFKDIYPDLDLSKEYDKIVPKKDLKPKK